MSRKATVGLPLAERALFTGGTATGSTELTAFDAALQCAGVHNANLLSISSVLPAGATVETDASPVDLESSLTPGGFYPAVYAAEASAEPGAELYAAVAGCRLESGYGINVERHGTGGDRDRVLGECRGMLFEMADNRGEDVVSEVWFHFETITVPDGARHEGAKTTSAEETEFDSDESGYGWACAVAAILYR